MQKKKDGSNAELISSQAFYKNDNGKALFNISNDWIFYTSSTSDYLYKIKTDGTNKKLLIKEPVSCPNIAGGYVFCKTYNDYERLKVSIDGGKVYILEDNN